MRRALLLIFSLSSLFALAQKRTTSIAGKIVDDNDHPVPHASVIILGKQVGITTSDSGTFVLKVISGRPFAIICSHTGYFDVQKNFMLNAGEHEFVIIRMEKQNQKLKEVIITDKTSALQDGPGVGLNKLNPKDAIIMPSATGGVEGMIKTFVGSNNELTSQYNVRGGNYDENLIYINDFEIYRPYLVNNAQQEGLSFINPELTKNINFYTGAFPARYSDKMSSVLDIEYKKPTFSKSSAYISLLEQGFHTEGSGNNKKFSYLLGVRNKTNRNLLSTQETTGNYIPSSFDIQSLLTYSISNKVKAELLGIFSGTSFLFIPESSKKSSAVFSPLFSADLGLDINFNGREKDNYQTGLMGLSIIQTLKSDLTIKWMLSNFSDIENENNDITGAYLFGQRDFDRSRNTFGQIINPLGAGVYQNYTRDHLQINVWNLSMKGSLEKQSHFIQWGAGTDKTIINGTVHEFQFQDSAGYSLPYNPSSISLNNVVNSNQNLVINKYNAFVQDNMILDHRAQKINVQAGVRANYNSLNKELLISPRIQLGFKPLLANTTYKFAAGIYDQPPFYREMLVADGSVNSHLKSQKSLQFVLGMEHTFKYSDKPVRFTAEAYYKNLWDVVPYQLENVNIKYAASNSAKAYATGFEMRWFTELVKGAESWLSVGLMKTQEKLDNAFYYDYKNAEGQIINSSTTDQKVTDSIPHQLGYIRRPSDRLFTIGLFLQDYLTTNKNFRINLNLIYGSNMPYSIPNNIKYRNALIIDPYIRADVGFSALLLSDKYKRRSHSPFKDLDNIWVSLEILNLIDRANTVSYQLVKDYSNTTFAIPDRLTPRLLNFKILTRF